MFKPLSFYIGLRYTRAKRRNHFISFISLMSMMGIALGVAVLITVLSVMNGFDKQISEQIFRMTPEVTVSSYLGGVSDWKALSANIATKHTQLGSVLGDAPYVSGQAMLVANGESQPMMVTGILPSEEAKVSDLNHMIVDGSLTALTQGSFGIVIGRTLAESWGLAVGGHVNVMTASPSVTPMGIIPRFKQFTVVGIFSAGNGFNFDNQFSFINMTDAQALFNMGNKVTGLRLKIVDGLAAPQFAGELSSVLPEKYIVGDWSDTYGPLFHAIAMEKNMMFLILLLIIMVAVFNLVSSLVMVVNEKQADIAILRTLGMRSKTVMAIFVVQGAVIGFVGTALGLIGGLLLSYNVTAVVNWIQSTFGVQLISSSVYFINYLPSLVEPYDVIRIILLSLGFSFLATIYPAWRASRTHPAEALRYE